ncbi:MAG: helix-turn-helix transcriptional regulator [Rubrivivax sp.]|nr:helix-turn-helix transcriptional regulator [Rubrivivax sp.]
MQQPTASSPLRFGRCRLDPATRELLVDGRPAHLGGRAFDLLVTLAENRHRMLSKSELLDRVWPGVVVEENNLQVQVSALRKLLGNGTISTIPGRGYRFTAVVADDAVLPVHAEPAASGGPPAPAASAASAAPTVAAPVLRTNLPTSPRVLHGRDDDLHALGALLGTRRLVSIVGAGGIGKTALAQRLLQQRAGSHAHGVCWVELADVADGGALPEAIAAALGVRIGEGDRLQGLTAALAPLDLLVGLDNAEHLADAVATAAKTLLAAAPGLRLLVTSQVPLRLMIEHVYRIGPLALPTGPVSAARAMEFGALALFVERAQAVNPRFALDDAGVADAVEICRRLDGLALAIELAAARTPLMGLKRLAAALDDRLRLLTSNRDRDAPARQQTLRAALEWSHGLLGERTQAVFRQLAVFSGSADLALIQDVVGGGADGRADGRPERDDWATLDALGELVDHSLVAVLDGADGTTSTTGPDGAPRYRLLDSAKALAGELLRASGELPALQQRHARAMAARFDAEFEHAFDGSVGWDAWLSRLAPDLDNARDAFAWAREHGAAATALSLGATLLCALPSAVYSEQMALADQVEAMVDACPDVGARLRGLNMLARAWGTRWAGRGLAAARRAVEIARAGGVDPFAAYLAESQLALMAMWSDDAETAAAAMAAMEALERPDWPPQRLLCGAEARTHAARMGLPHDAARALQMTRRQLELERAQGSAGLEARFVLIDVLVGAGDAEAAVREGEALLAAVEGTREEYAIAGGRANLTEALVALGDTARARSVAQAGWAMIVRHEMQGATAPHLALLAALEGRMRAAAMLIGFADADYAARRTTPHPCEAMHARRAMDLAVAVLGEAEFQRRSAAGRSLDVSRAGAVAFAGADVD